MFAKIHPSLEVFACNTKMGVHMRLLQVSLAILALVLSGGLSYPACAFGAASGDASLSENDAIPILSMCSTSVRNAGSSSVLSICPAPGGTSK
jgi:hypothetical protein